MLGKRTLLLAYLLTLSQILLAQLCQGSLGDPLVNITFGAGANPGPPLRAGKTSYQYLPTDCPDDGSYTIRSRSDKCYGGWHTLNRDHTGDPNGYFMLVNASHTPGTFYIDTVNLACSNTTYEFAAWVSNMNNPSECGGNAIRPNLTFTIEKVDGTLLQSFNSGDIIPETAPTWRQVGFFFTAPPLVNQVVLKIRNNAPGGCGNDIALDDITFRPCGAKLNVNTSSGARWINLCEGTPEQVSFEYSPASANDNMNLQWQSSNDGGATWINIPGGTTASLNHNFSATTPVGTYLFRLAASKVENNNILACRVHSELITIRVNPKPIISISGNSHVCEQTSLNLSASGGVRYNWVGSNGFSTTGSPVSIPTIQLSQAGRYIVTGFDVVGCQNKDSLEVVVHPKPQIALNGNEHTICEGDTVQLQANGGNIYSWSPAIGLSEAGIPDPFAYPSDSTSYTVSTSNQNGCIGSAQVIIKVHKRPVANAGPDREIGQGQSTTLLGRSVGSEITYSWSPATAIDNATSIQPTVQPAQDAEYVLTVSSNVGCGVSSDTVRVKVYKGVYVPSAFTPNGDGKNDLWQIIGLSVYPSYDISVFNRYGQVIYYSKNATNGWDGKHNKLAVPVGSYPYLIRIKSENRVMKGILTVIR